MLKYLNAKRGFTHAPLSKTKSGAGFTLVEMLVAVAVFSIIIGVTSGLFVSAIRAQRQILATQKILSQTSYVMEYMGRALRMAKKDLGGTCIVSGSNYENPDGDTSIQFLDYEGICTKFFLETETGLLKKTVGATTLLLISSDLQVVSLKFKLIGEKQPPPSLGDDLQPRVTIFLEVGGAQQSKIKIQTTISQRDLDVEY